jgi:hypothetical protein
MVLSPPYTAVFTAGVAGPSFNVLSRPLNFTSFIALDELLCGDGNAAILPFNLFDNLPFCASTLVLMQRARTVALRAIDMEAPLSVSCRP